MARGGAFSLLRCRITKDRILPSQNTDPLVGGGKRKSFHNFPIPPTSGCMSSLGGEREKRNDRGRIRSAASCFRCDAIEFHPQNDLAAMPFFSAAIHTFVVCALFQQAFPFCCGQLSPRSPNHNGGNDSPGHSRIWLGDLYRAVFYIPTWQLLSLCTSCLFFFSYSF